MKKHFLLMFALAALSTTQTYTISDNARDIALGAVAGFIGVCLQNVTIPYINKNIPSVVASAIPNAGLALLTSANDTCRVTSAGTALTSAVISGFLSTYFIKRYNAKSSINKDIFAPGEACLYGFGASVLV